MINLHKSRIRLLACSGLSVVLLAPGVAFAQAADESDNVGLEEIIVTAQKREQSVQDVPIAVTALTGDALEANRVADVTDLSGLAPGVTVRPAAGSSQIPSFTVRGVVSYGVVPGSDKQVSIYLDGVYISSPRASIFDLPDVERIEMLRGPQGTLFGRNATAGAVSISTRDPRGEIGVKARITVGNYDQFRFGVSVDTPQVGPFSAYLSYMHTYKRGDIRNLAAGQVWDRSRSPGDFGIRVSPKYLGTKDGDSYFAALKFEPSDSFKMVYKFDRNTARDTADAQAVLNFNATSPGTGPLLAALIPPSLVVSDGKRPKSVSNGWAVPGTQRVSGHSVTSTWQASDNLTFKNITAYRKSYIFAASPLDGIGGIPLNANALTAYAALAAPGFIPGFANIPAANRPAVIAAALPGIVTALTNLGFLNAPFGPVVTQPASSSRQWSSELQANYTSDLATVTVGALWFKGKDAQGAPGLTSTPTFTAYPGGIVPLGQTARTYNNATSLAAYGQAEIHVLPTVDVVLGARITKDKKTGVLYVGRAVGPLASVDQLLGQLLPIPFRYKKTKPNFLAGINWKPTDDLLVYGKFSTAFVSGGAVAGVPFEPETARSFEAGLKADLFDRRLRTNLAIYTVTYKNFQTAQGGTNFATYLNGVGAAAGIPGLNDGSPNAIQLAQVIGTFILPQGGPVKNKGFEFEATAAPLRGVTLGGSLGYSKTTFTDVNPVILASNGPNAAGQFEYPPTLRPKWTGSLSAAYESEPFAGDMRFTLRADGNWHSKERLLSGRAGANPLYARGVFVPASWTVNARASLKDIDLGGIKTELAVWSRNLFNNKDLNYALNLGPITGISFVAARTVGVDLNISF